MDEETGAAREIEIEKQITQIVGYDSEGYRRTTFSYRLGDQSGTCLVEEENGSYTVGVNTKLGPTQSDPRYFTEEECLETQSANMQEAAVEAVARYLDQDCGKTAARARLF